MKEIRLSDYFQPRDYQRPMINAFRSGCRRIISCQARRSGKDVCAFSLMIEAALQRVGVYWYIWPNAEQGRKNAWNGKLNNGKPFLSLIPEECIQSKNISDMSIRLFNNSIIQICGSEKIDSLMGGGPVGIILTEFALADNQEAFELLLPMIRASDGFFIIISTPRGRNRFYSLMKIAQANPKIWFSQILTIDETKHISAEAIEEDIRTGVMSYESAQQEYWCNFDLGVSTTIYGASMDKMRVQKRITDVPYMSEYPVHSAFDIGRDMTSVIFFQVVQTSVHVIDYYERSGENLEHFVKYIKKLDYNYGIHFFPHDGAVIEWAGPRYTRQFKARQLGLEVQIVDRVRLEDGIEWTRSKLSRVWIDETKCAQLIKCLEGYRYIKDQKKGINAQKPLHDWASHGASAMMYLCLSLDRTSDSMTEKDAEKIRHEALYGGESNLHPIFEERTWR